MKVATKIELSAWDAADYLDTEADMALYLDAALAENDPALVAAALGDIARAKGMSTIARETGLSRESLYRSLSPNGNPELGTVLKVADCLGLRFHVTA